MMRAYLHVGNLVALAAIGTLSLGCDSGLQEDLNTSKDTRFAAAAGNIAAVEADRLNKLKAGLPAPNLEGAASLKALLEWRKSIKDRNDDTALNFLAVHTQPDKQPQPDETLKAIEGVDMAVGGRGTPAELPAERGAAFALESKEYWDGKSSNARYLTFLGTYLKDAERDKAEALAKDPNAKLVPTPFIDEAKFDLVFAHAIRYLLIRASQDGDKVTSAVQPYWETAFDFPAKSSESFSDYISRVCFAHPKLQEKCKGVPHEYRAQVVNTPYVRELKTKVEEYVKGRTDKNAMFADILGRFGTAFDSALGKVHVHTEDPVLPSTFAPVEGISGIKTSFSKKTGFKIEGQSISPSFTGAVPMELTMRMTTLTDTLKATPGNRINIANVVVELDGDSPMTTIADIIRAFPPVVKKTLLVGRRRVDGSMRRAPISIKRPKKSASPTISFKFAEDAAPASCDMVGFTGRPLLGKDKKSFFLHITPSKIRAAETTYQKELRQFDAGATVNLGSPADMTQLLAWLEKNEGEIQLFLGGGFTYDDAMKHLSRVLYKCIDQEMVFDAGTPKERTVTRPCGKTEPFESTVVVAMCR